MKLSNCRICKHDSFSEIIDLGTQYLTGVFPKTKEEKVTSGELVLVKCDQCELVQLSETFDLDEMYGDNYGYRSGLNQHMVKHLHQKINRISKMIPLQKDDLVIDIGSNDSTTLQAYSKDLVRVGIDPTGKKFKQYYPADIRLIPDFFTEEAFKKEFDQKAKIITSIAMFYDLEDPNIFVKDIFNCLDDEGIWHFEQSYLLSMLRTNSYDTICHEHLEFYSLNVINNLLEKHGLTILDVEFNDINGGSFAITACKKGAKTAEKRNNAVIDWMLEQEKVQFLNETYSKFKKDVEIQKEALLSLLKRLKSEGKKVFGYGASTKGNVLLQYCNIGPELVHAIVEVNPDKFGSFTPGTLIPIVSEADAFAQEPDYLLVLPWHFRNNILQRETAIREKGIKFIFPLPFVEIV